MAKSPIPAAPLPDGEIVPALDSGERLLQTMGKALHDGLCQDLGAGLIQLRVLQERTRTGQPLQAADLDTLADTLQKAVKSARSIEGRLRPFDAGPGGLMSGLARLAAETSLRVPCRFVCEEPVLWPDAPRSLLLFRAAEEAVGAALARPERTALEVTLQMGEAAIEIGVEDIGRPLPDPVAVEKNYRVSRLRAEMGGATWQCHANSNGGLKVLCSFPLRA